ncbi:MAG: hypothetical protein ACF8Q5_08350 [Phycisphaerales bacterium JB040]
MINDNAILTREDRDDLASAAAAADRRNRPTGLIVLGGIVLLVGVVLVVAALISLARARGTWSTQIGRIQQAGALAAEYQALQSAASDTDNIRVHDPVPTMISDLAGLAQRSGVEVGIPDTGYRPLTTPGARTAVFSYDNISDDSLSEILDWIDRTVTTVPGMRAEEITLRLTSPIARGRTPSQTPEQQWRMDVAFARTEKTN